MSPTLLITAALLAATRVLCPQGAPTARTAEALTALLQAEGPLDVWIAGTVHGDFEASRRVRLHGCEEGALRGSGTGTVLRIKGDDVLVEDLHLSGSGSRASKEDGALKVSGERAVVRRIAVENSLYGIAFEQCHSCVLEDSVVVGRAGIAENLRGDGIKLWESHQSVVRRNRVSGVRDCVVWYSRHVTLEENVITGGRYGTHFMYAHDSTVRRSVLRDNVVGVFFMYSARVHALDNILAGARGPAGMGVGFKESDAVVLERNAIVANTVGAFLDSTPRDPNQPVRFDGNSFALNGVALRAHGSERGASFLRNDFLDNGSVVEVDGNGDARDVTFENNHWSTYAGYDLNRDGVGDVAYLVKQPASDLRSANPNLKFFQGTAALTLYDALADAMPFFGSRIMLEDVRPAMRPHGVSAR